MCLTILNYIFAFPLHYQRLLGSPNLTPLLAILQLSIDYALIIITASLGFLMIFRVRREFMGVLTSILLVSMLPNLTGLGALPIDIHPIFRFTWFINLIGISSLALLFIISLPDGYPIRSLLWIVPIAMIYDLGRYIFLYALATENVLSLRTVAVLPNYIILFIALIGMVQRYRYQPSSLQKQQFKWFFWGITTEISILITIQLWRGFTILMGGNQAIASLIFSFFNLIGTIIVCISFIFAVSRNGLWNVDLTINRSVVTGIVTLFLMIWFGIVFIISQFIIKQLLNDNRSDIAIAISALLVGITFNPARKRVRTFVDRRLYGFRFDLNQLKRHRETIDVKNPGALTGKTLGGYELLDVVGRGGMGEVYKGFGNNEFVAIKILQQDHSLDQTMRQRFTREGKITLNHPHIVKTLSAGESDNIFYLIMEYVEGQTLKEVIGQTPSLSLTDIQHYAHNLADAIDYAHAQGYVHPDIKPSNIMLCLNPDSETYKVMLMDFGVAKFLGDTTSLTGSAAVGTIDYMAPEQIKDSTTVDYRTDIYALGIVLYEVLTGVVPFKGALGQVLFAHLNQPAPDIRQLRPDLPTSVSSAIQRALQKNPDDRFQSAKQFVDALTFSS